MRDDYLSPEWAERHEEIGRSVDLLWRGVREAFAVLNRIQWARPWERSETCCRG